MKKQLGKHRVNSIALISSPFQLLGLKELLTEDNEIKAQIYTIVNTDKDSSLDQILNVAKYLNLEIEKKYIVKKRGLQYFRLIFSFLTKKYNYLILGAYFNSVFYLISRLCSYKNLIFLDDGLETVLINKMDPAKESIISKFFNWKYKRSKHFTIFSNSIDNIFGQNKFISLQSKFYNRSVNEEVFVLGGNFVEAGMISSKNYLKHIQKIKNQFKSKKIVYIPHRKEIKLNYEKYDIDILITDSCFEIYLAKLEYLPSVIISFFSTALYTSKLILSNYPKVKILNYHINFKGYELQYDIFSDILEKENIKTINYEI